MQPQMTTLLAMSNGTSMVTESIFDTRFKYVDELRRMGADITVDSRVAVVRGVDHLTGAPVKGERPQSRCGAYHCRTCGAGHYGNRRYSPY